MSNNNLNNGTIINGAVFKIGATPIRDTTGFSYIHRHGKLPLTSHKFAQLLAHIEKRMKYNVSFDPLGGSIAHGVDVVGVRVPNSMYYTCMLGIQGGNEIQYKSPRLDRARHNYKGMWRNGFSSGDVRRVANLVAKIQPIYDPEVISRSVHHRQDSVDDALNQDSSKLRSIEHIFARDIGYMDSTDLARFVKQAIRSAQSGTVMHCNPEDKVVEKYEKYMTTKRELEESVESVGERVALHVLKLFGCDDIILAHGNKYVRFAGVGALPEEIQTTIHTVNTMMSGVAENVQRQQGFKCAVGTLLASRDALAETHYGVFLPLEDATPILKNLDVRGSVLWT